METTVEINAKVNLSLNIISKDRQGMHCLDMITASVSLSDVVFIRTRQDKSIRISMQNTSAKIPKKDNTAYRAAALFQRDFDTCGFDIIVQKNIPQKGGLGGSAADAAGVLLGLDKMFSPKETPLKTQARALQIGSDVPVMMKGGFCHVNSIGNATQFSCKNLQYFFVLAKPKNGISTKKCFEKFDQIYIDFCHCPTDNNALKTALISHDYAALCTLLDNALYVPATHLMPALAHHKKTLSQYCDSVTMTGSGSCLIGLCSSLDHATHAAHHLQDKFAFVTAVSTTGGF